MGLILGALRRRPGLAAMIALAALCAVQTARLSASQHAYARARRDGEAAAATLALQTAALNRARAEGEAVRRRLGEATSRAMRAGRSERDRARRALAAAPRGDRCEAADALILQSLGPAGA